MNTVEIPEAMVTAFESVIAERERQNKKWGEQNHNPQLWCAILTEEVGEYAQAGLAVTFGDKVMRDSRIAHMREEAVQCAAVALQIVECIDRNKTAKLS